MKFLSSLWVFVFEVFLVFDSLALEIFFGYGSPLAVIEIQ